MSELVHLMKDYEDVLCFFGIKSPDKSLKIRPRMCIKDVNGFCLDFMLAGVCLCGLYSMY